MYPRRETRSLDIRRSCCDLLDRRRSAEMCRSTRRYDEHWGAAERSDTRLKCGDGVIHHVHSQIVSSWSPVLRDMVNLYPTPHLLESTHGLAYLLHVEEDSWIWTAVLDMMYPTPSKPLDWDLLERCLLLADKYDMACLVDRLSCTLLDPSRSFSMDPASPAFALRWLGLAEQLQLQDVAAHVQSFLQPAFRQLGSQPAAMSAVLAYARDNLSKEQLLQLLQITMQAANAPQAIERQQHQQQHSMSAVTPCLPTSKPQQIQMQQQQPEGMNVDDWFRQEQQNHGQNFMQPQLQQQQSYWAMPLPNQALVAPSCSGTSSPVSHGTGALSDEASSEPRGITAVAAAEDDGAADAEQQRMTLCLSSGLFTPAYGSSSPTAASMQAAATACNKAPVPSFSCAPVSEAMQQQRQQQHAVFSMHVDARGAAAAATVASGFDGPSFALGVNGGSTSIAEWMKNSFLAQSEGMCA